MIIGAHATTAERGWSVHRNSGLLTIMGTLVFGFSILTTRGEVINTPGWQPMLEWGDGYVILAGWLLLAGVLGLAGLSLEQNDGKIYPRIITLISAFVGASWFATATVGFARAYVDGYENAGIFLGPAFALLHINRIWLLGEKQFLRRGHGS